MSVLYHKYSRTFLLFSITAILIALPARRTAAADSIFDGLFKALGIKEEEPRAARVIRVAPAPAVDEDEVNQFSPTLGRLLRAELHFVRKVCQPTPEQLAEIRKHGKTEVVKISRKMVQLQQQMPDFPDARQTLTTALASKIEEVCPKEAAARYRQEVAARENAKREAAANLMVRLIDREFMLSEEQAEKVQHSLLTHWNEDWSRNLQTLMYPQYAPWPDRNLVIPSLDKLQQTLWVERPHRGRIQFGWEAELGFNSWVHVNEVKDDLDDATDTVKERK